MQSAIKDYSQFLINIIRPKHRSTNFLLNQPATIGLAAHTKRNSETSLSPRCSIKIILAARLYHL